MEELSAQPGFEAPQTEYDDYTLDVDGDIPEWISGSLIRNGPGQFQVGGTYVNHWFDGLALLRKYAFDTGSVRYSNRFLRTQSYEQAANGSLTGQFGTDVSGIRRLISWVKRVGPPSPTDNANVHLARLGGSFVALTEVPEWVAFDPGSLETEGRFQFEDLFPAHTITAHLVADPHRNEHVGHALEFGRPHQYHLFRIPEGRRRRDRITSIPTKKPGYIHSIGVSEDHLVLVECPLRIDFKRALSPFSEGFLDLLSWQEDRDTRVYVIDRVSGTIVRETTLEPFFMFHTANAFDSGETVVVDLVAFEDPSIIDALGTDRLMKDGFGTDIQGELCRIRIPPTGEPTYEVLYPGGIELPTVPRRQTTQPYRYAYGQVTDRQNANGLVKVDTERKRAREWWEQDLFIEEPIFVPHPDSSESDEGVVLATAVDVAAKSAQLLVFDAKRLTLRARATIPHVTPFGFHGRFFETEAVTDQ